MEHADIIAYLFPLGTGDVGDTALKAIEASPRYMLPRLHRPTAQYHRRHERQSTEPLENPGASPLDYLPCLAVRFSDIPRTQNGFIFGHNPNCDVVLDSLRVSNVHFSLTFDDHNRPIIKDLNSLVGTEVTYDRGGEGIRRNFQWIVGGHRIPQEMKSIVITVPNAVSFQIVVPFHHIKSPTYVDKVNRFNQGAATTEGLLNDLGLSYPPTRPLTGAHTPSTGQIYLTKKLGEGSFGVVNHLWDVSTGDERAVKEPTLKAVRKGQVNHEAWRREAHIMGQVSHDHIVRLIQSVSTPQPQLHLEYVPCGSLDDHEDISYNETLTITRQCLSALAYLHGRAIAHRDIKPANILVQYRYQGDIYIKLADFGLARDGSELMTMCGSRTYLAPEIYSEFCRDSAERLGYTTAVDIWSLGAVACELLSGLPRYKEQYVNNGEAWCEKIENRLRKYLQRAHNDLGQFLLDAMVILSPESRLAAGDCYARAMSLRHIDDLHTSTPASYIGEVEETTERHTTRENAVEEATIVARQPPFQTVDNPSSSPYFVRSGTSPLESFPSLSAKTQRTDEADQHEAHQSPSSANQHADWRGRELAHFLEDYSADPLNSLYVGSSLAHLGGTEPDSWTSGFSQHSREQDANAAGSPAGLGSGISKSSVPRSEKRGWCLENEITATEGFPTSKNGYEEMAQAAFLLQAIGQDARAWQAFPPDS